MDNREESKNDNVQAINPQQLYEIESVDKSTDSLKELVAAVNPDDLKQEILPLTINNLKLEPEGSTSFVNNFGHLCLEDSMHSSTERKELCNDSLSVETSSIVSEIDTDFWAWWTVNPVSINFWVDENNNSVSSEELMRFSSIEDMLTSLTDEFDFEEHYERLMRDFPINC